MRLILPGPRSAPRFHPRTFPEPHLFFFRQSSVVSDRGHRGPSQEKSDASISSDRDHGCRHHDGPGSDGVHDRNRFRYAQRADTAAAFGLFNRIRRIRHRQRLGCGHIRSHGHVEHQRVFVEHFSGTLTASRRDTEHLDAICNFHCRNLEPSHLSHLSAASADVGRRLGQSDQHGGWFA
jgi:hypothetical protein